MELKPCPFCGSELKEEYCDFYFQYGTEDREGIPVNVVCIRCTTQGPWDYGIKDDELHQKYVAIKLWNKRKE